MHLISFWESEAQPVSSSSLWKIREPGEYMSFTKKPLLSSIAKQGEKSEYFTIQVLQQSFLPFCRWCPKTSISLMTDLLERGGKKTQTKEKAKKLHLYLFLAEIKKVTVVTDSLPHNSQWVASLTYLFTVIQMGALWCPVYPAHLGHLKWWTLESFSKNWDCVSVSTQDGYIKEVIAWHWNIKWH